MFEIFPDSVSNGGREDDMDSVAECVEALTLDWCLHHFQLLALQLTGSGGTLGTLFVLCL